MSKNVFYYEFPVCKIGICEEDDFITRVFFSEKQSVHGFENAETELLERAALQLTEYFSGNRGDFVLPLKPHGTAFQQTVWNALRQIPFGETRSYEEIAVSVGNPKACRAVGMANNRNPIAIIVPCHRVIGKNGGLTGYAGGLPVKEYLLEIEKKSALLSRDRD